MLALLTLSKLIKLEAVALYRLCVSKQYNQGVNLYDSITVSIYYFIAKLNDGWCSYALTNCLSTPDTLDFDETFTLNLPMPYITAKAGSGDAVATIDKSNDDDRNPNRFIKSSFTLSLLWVAKLYSSFTPNSLTNACIFKAYTAFMRVFSKQMITVFDSTPNTRKYLGLSH